MKNVLVTGGAGFVGHHLVDRLISIGYKVTVVDNLSSGKISRVHEKADFIEGDINNKDLLVMLMKNCEYVFHLAAFIQLQESIKKPIDCFNNNINGTINVIMSAIENKVKKILFASSSSVYPLESNQPLYEDMKLEGESPYAMSKIICEKLIEFYCKNSQTSYCSLRCFNIYGRGQDINSDYAAVIPKFILLSKKGDDLPLYNGGKQTRDFINVEDVIEAYIDLAKSNFSGVFNVGSGKEISIKNIAEKIISIENKSKMVEKPMLKGDALRSLADISKINEKIGFTPKINLDEALKDLYENFKSTN